MRWRPALAETESAFLWTPTNFVLDLFEPSGSLRAGLLAQTMDFAVAMGFGSAFVRK